MQRSGYQCGMVAAVPWGSLPWRCGMALLYFRRWTVGRFVVLPTYLVDDARFLKRMVHVSDDTWLISPCTLKLLENIWMFPNIRVPQNGWFIMEIPIKNGWFGGTTTFGNTYIMNTIWNNNGYSVLCTLARCALAQIYSFEKDQHHGRSW